MRAHECLEHPWLKDNKDQGSNSSNKPNEHVICTKNLRRFVIRRRWQVN